MRAGTWLTHEISSKKAGRKRGKESITNNKDLGKVEITFLKNLLLSFTLLKEKQKGNKDVFLFCDLQGGKQNTPLAHIIISYKRVSAGLYQENAKGDLRQTGRRDTGRGNSLSPLAPCAETV